MMSHTGERPFVCTVCGKSYCQKDGLKRHMFVHTGEMPFICKVCGKVFSQIFTIKQHMMSQGKGLLSVQSVAKATVKRVD